MLPVSEVSQNGHASTQNSSQSQVIASVVAQQKVIASQRNAASGGSGNETLSSNDKQAKAVRNNTINRDKKAQAERTEQKQIDAKTEQTKSAEARSIIEAKEKSASDAEAKVTAAFMGRHSFNDMLNVIRDPEDRVLPKEPSNLDA
jgi:hypothetical protein